MASPGGPAADPLWKALVGASPADADAFVDKLLGARAGRLAWLYDTVSRLDAGMQRHLLDGDGALDRLRRLADVFTRVNPEWRIEDRPLWRPLVDPATLLLELETRPDGSPTLPEPAAWAGTFGRPEQVDAAWLVDRVFSGDRSAIRDRFDLALFAMRWTRDGRERGVSRRARPLRGRAGAGVDARADRRPRQRRGHAPARARCSSRPCARMRRRCAWCRRRWR